MSLYCLRLPHEGRCQLSLTPSIVGLMRNSLSEAIHFLVCLYRLGYYYLLFLQFSCLFCGYLLFSCLKYSRGSESPRH